MRKKTNSIGAFLDFFETSAVLIDTKNNVVKVNQKLIEENKKFNFFKYNQNYAFYLLKQIDRDDWDKCLNRTFEDTSAKFNLNSSSFECVMNLLQIDEEKYVQINFLANKSLKEIGAEVLLNDWGLAQFKEQCEKKARHIAHEINNPLTIISARTQLLQQKIIDQTSITNEVLSQNLDKIFQQAERIKIIVDELRAQFKNESQDNSAEVNIFKRSS